VAAAPAQASTTAKLCTIFGNQLGLDSPDVNTGTQMDLSSCANARNLTFTDLGPGADGHEQFHIQVYNGNYVAATTSCLHVSIKGSVSDYGTVWETFGSGGENWASRPCSGSLPGSYQLTSDNVSGDLAEIAGENCSGCYQAWALH
jgi:hypothetical protein